MNFLKKIIFLALGSGALGPIDSIFCETKDPPPPSPLKSLKSLNPSALGLGIGGGSAVALGGVGIAAIPLAFLALSPRARSHNPPLSDEEKGDKEAKFPEEEMEKFFKTVENKLKAPGKGKEKEPYSPSPSYDQLLNRLIHKKVFISTQEMISLNPTDQKRLSIANKALQKHQNEEILKISPDKRRKSFR